MISMDYIMPLKWYAVKIIRDKSCNNYSRSDTVWKLYFIKSVFISHKLSNESLQGETIL